MQSRLNLPHSPRSLLHQLDPRWKLAAIGCGMATAIMVRTWPSAALLLLIVLLLLLTARVPWRALFLRLGGIALVLSLFLALVPFAVSGEPVGLGPLTATREGIRLAGLICLKAVSIAALALLLLTTSPLEQTLKAAHQLRVPGMVVQLLLLTYRYVFVLLDELGKLRIALRLRRFRNRVSRHAYRTLGHITGTLLIRSYERAERVGQAMRCRGFRGEFYILQGFRTRPFDVAGFLILVLLVVVLPVTLDWHAWEARRGP